jgi:hypothetical protein
MIHHHLTGKLIVREYPFKDRIIVCIYRLFKHQHVVERKREEGKRETALQSMVME